ncbi:winged helix-turn-helix transcriptional regulator [Mycobacterium sp. CBMA293]|uniref:MarR family winged helix-turn-helix transcriptional regulator n=1 Tax=unclassified Mycolicibacterium TaxID=2636767 RepID=UPI0012DFE486|nr:MULTISPECIES: MarR family winged helix-turn-helix transcriptional regulator [unclassified Mycolicibacterium]MUL48310.1 winged helix-turn-helix transcriptional regulator [Mycolicibacterium sp. CBMA 360]MUL57523.1 winged helix-turn-helix transcriptional regulator [Mycolicibacterium sp. CBMA 335]MUL70563.1 winged helix-turn-helix transcriptional regulator [Mycolicibacterium sp. CBMA 311]MUL92611.1 winged helix-turn-helix transcriptional regulator [Mycolicibacterium sp. CBMA 230]MUM04988.1 MarR
MVTASIDEIAGNCLAVRVRLLGRAVTGLYDRALEGHGVSIAQVNLMAALGKAGPCSPARIGEVLQLERSTVSRNLSLLMKHGWVEAVSADAKGVREVALTSSGRKKIETVMPEWRQAQEEAAQLLGVGGVKAVRTLATNIGPLPGG